MTVEDNPQKIREDRALLSQQNKEYEESLAKDLAKKEEKEKMKLEAERKEQRKKTIQEYRQKLKGVEFRGPLQVLVRYPTGARTVLGFSPSDKIERLFDAVISNPACPDYFSVRSVYPRAEIHCYPTWYRDAFNAEVDEESRLPEKSQEDVVFEHSIITNNSILFINMIH